MIKNIFKILTLAVALLIPSVAMADKAGLFSGQPTLTQAEVDNYCKKVKLVPVIMGEDPKASAAALKELGVEEKRFLYMFFKIHTFIFIEEGLAKPEDFNPHMLPNPAEKQLLNQNIEKLAAALAKLERKPLKN